MGSGEAGGDTKTILGALGSVLLLDLLPFVIRKPQKSVVGEVRL